jgi:hypothetical protein
LIETGGFLAGLAAGDLDGDGKPDLAVLGGNEGAGVRLLLNRGGGDFAAGGAMPVSDFGQSIALADFDRDGDLDVAVGHADWTGNYSGYLSIFNNSGGGRFALSQTFSLGKLPSALAAGDLDGDGKLDLAVADGEGDGTVHLVWGAGDGTFPEKVSVRVGKRSLAGVVLADLDQDGKLDLAAWSASEQETWTAENLGGRTFAAAVDVASSDSMAIGDLNGDRAPDLVVTSAAIGLVGILRNDGHGGFPDVEYLVQGAFPWKIWTADLNLDGTWDVIVDFEGTWGLEVFLRGPRGAIGSPIGIPAVGQARFLAAADFDGDGTPDLAVGDQNSGAISLVLAPPRPPRSIDSNGDGIPDDCGSVFRRCDANVDGKIDISDGIRIFNALFRGAPHASCLRAEDCNGDGRVDISDGLYSIAYQLLGGSAPPPPFPHCGSDPLASELSCTAHPPCGW